MTTGGDTAEAVILISAANQASEELDQISNDVGDLNESLFGFSRNAIGAGIAALGLSFGLKEALDASGQAQDIDAQTDAILRLLGPDVRAAFDALTPLFDEIGESVGALERDVKRAATVITQNTGGIVPSAEELAFAFDLAVAAGTDLETAAAAVGQAMQGNVAPLNALLDPSGRSYITLKQAMEDLEGTSGDAESGFDKLQRRMGEAIEEVGNFFDRLLEIMQRDTEWDFSFFTDFFTDTIPQVFGDAVRTIAQLSSAMWRTFWENFVKPISEFFSDLLPELIDQLGDFFRSIGSGIGGLFNTSITGGTAGSGDVHVTINGNVDSPERVQQVAREMSRQLQQNNRRGVNVSA